jgi:iron complex transport system substrate-binding protein
MITLLVGAAFAGTVTDNRGETITADAPQRIVSLGGGVTELVYALGAGDRVVAVDASSGYPEAVESVTKLGYHRQVGAEGILSLSPDLVIATTDAGPPASMEQIEAAGVPLLVLDSSPGIDALKGRIQVLSDLLDVSDKGAELQAGIDASLGQVAADGDAPRVMFIYARGGGTLNVSGTNTAAAEMISLAGGVNAVDGYEGYRPLTAESAVMAAPDVLLLTEGGLGSLGGAEGLLKQPGIGLTPAGQNQRIVVMDDLYLLGFGPRTGAAAQELSVQFRAPQ